LGWGEGVGCGTCVVLPHPVSPSTTTTGWSLMAAISCAR
jgi:hypothetical protein